MEKDNFGVPCITSSYRLSWLHSGKLSALGFLGVSSLVKCSYWRQLSGDYINAHWWAARPPSFALQSDAVSVDGADAENNWLAVPSVALLPHFLSLVSAQTAYVLWNSVWWCEKDLNNIQQVTMWGHYYKGKEGKVEMRQVACCSVWM